jgi:uncharacterized membrane protein YgdD (TMEM256/DUF423 family)
VDQSFNKRGEIVFYKKYINCTRRMQWQRVLGGLSGAMSVGAGAYGSHGMKGKEEAYAKVFQTGSHYQLVHSALLVATPAICGGGGSRASKVAGAFLASGIVLFSGSCYAVGILEDRSVGKAAPVGGFALIFGWISLAVLRR